MSHEKNLRSDTALEQARHLTLFSWLLGLYFVTQYLYIEGAAPPLLIRTCALFSSTLLLLFPSSTPVFLVAASLEWSTAWSYMPMASNHTLLSLLLLASILIGYTSRVLRTGRFGIARVELFDSFAPTARWLLVLLYFFCTFHKLNWDFLDPGWSCAVMLASRTPLLGDLHALIGSPYAVIASTLLIEAALAVLLVVPRWRTIGVFTGVLFHLMLASNRYDLIVPFSALTTAMLSLFLSPTHITSLWSSRLIRSLQSERMVRTARLCIIGLVIALVEARRHDHNDIIRSIFAMWTLSGVVILYTAARGSFTRTAGWSALVPSSAVQACIVALCIANGFGPYLGLKTQQTFNMFSNLVTERGATNHLIIPAPWYVGRDLNDIVSITESTHPYLDRLARAELDITYASLRQTLTADPSHSVSFTRNGQLQVWKPGDVAGRTTGYIDRKVFTFLPIAREKPGACAASERYLEVK